MRSVVLAGALALGGCQLTASIGSAEQAGSSEGTGGSGDATGSTSSTTAGAGTGTGTGTGTTSGATGATSGTAGSSTWGTESDTWGTGPDPCHMYDNPQLCFSQGCVWSFPFDECHDEGGDGTGFNPPDECLPDMQDNQCVDCLKFGCCQALVACERDPDCACFLSCLEQNNPVLQCQGACQPSGGAAYLSMCAGNACFPSCG